MSVRPSVLSEILGKFIPERMPVLVTGAPGVGKSDVVAAAANTAKADMILSHPVVSDPTDYKGMPFVIEGQADFLPFADLKALISAKKPTVFFLDDLGQALPAVQAAAMQLLLARQINGHRISEKVSFVAATNRREDKAGVTAILEPVKSRFATIVELVPNLEDWIAWAYKNDMPETIIGFVRWKPAVLTDFKPSAEMKNTACPRTVANAGKIMKLGMPFHITRECLAGAAGEGFATEFSAYAKSREDMPDPEKIIADPDSGPIDLDASVMFALCTALAFRATKKTFPNIIRYANRLTQVEYSVLIIKDAIKRNESLAVCREFIDWTMKNREVFLG